MKDKALYYFNDLADYMLIWQTFQSLWLYLCTRNETALCKFALDTAKYIRYLCVRVNYKNESVNPDGNYD